MHTQMKCIELHCRKFGNGKLIQKLKKGIMNITEKFEMNNLEKKARNNE